MAHTGGPWRLGNLESYDAYTGKPFRNVWTGNDTCIARAIDNGDVDANARLIAAAPEMLEALEQAHAMLKIMSEFGHLDDLCQSMHPDEINKTCDAVSLAIRAARGE